MSNNIKNKGNKKISAVKTEKKSQHVIYRMLIILALDLIVISSFISIKKDAVRENVLVFDILPVLTAALAALFAASIGYCIFVKVKSIDTSRYVVTPYMISGIALVGFSMCLLYKNMSLQKIIIGLIIVSVIYFIYYLYKRSFFVYSVLTGAAYILTVILGSVTYSSNNPGVNMAVKVTAIAAGLAAGLLVFAAKGKNGTISVGKRAICLYENKLDLISLALTIGLLLVSAAVSFFSAGVVSYMSLILLGSFLVIAIIYTIKMI